MGLRKEFLKEMSTYTRNMTEGSELKHILFFTLPLLAGNLFQQLYNIVDSAIVGKFLGADALGSVGSTGSATFLFYNLCYGLATGAGILIAQSFGAGRDEDVKKLIANSAYVMGAFGLLVSVISVVFAPNILRILNTRESFFDTALGYMRISCAGTIAVSAYNWINAVMRSLGDSKTPLFFLIVASLLNAGLDLLFVVGFNMGVNGAAWATITAQGISAAGSIIFAFCKNPCFKLKRKHLAPNRNMLIKCVKTGAPISFQNALISLSMAYLQRTANRFEDNVVSAYTATMRIEQLIQQPFSSLNVAVSTFAGQNIGSEKPERAVKGYHQSLKAVGIFSTVMLGVFFLFSENIMGIFLKQQDMEVIAIGAAALKLSACFYFPLGVIHTTRGLLNGAGDVGYAMINGVAEIVGRVGFAIILVHIPIVGHWAVWGTSALTWLLTAIMSVVRYKGGKWAKKSVVKN